MNKTIVETNEYILRLLSSTWSGPVVLYISNEQFGDEGERIKDGVEQMSGVPFTFCELLDKNWDRYLTPWKANVNLKGRVFQGQAMDLLHYLEDNFVPKIREYVKDTRIYIAGYSLAGLFSLWSLYESELFDGAACCSGSLWYPGWKEYAMQHPLKKSCSVYLSLGKKEKNAKHPLMKNVEDAMKLQYELLQQDRNIDMLHMDWHEGGHFNNMEKRMEMGIRWLIAYY